MNTFPQNLLKTKNGLYLFVNGSGRLYQLQDDSAGIQPHRLDSTIFFGYNFGSFPFVFHDTIYSLGGYGMWRINGQLRAYIPQAHLWDIVPLNKEIPVLMQEENHNLLWYDEQRAKLCIAYSIVRNQAVKHSSLNEAVFNYTLRCLNLQTKEWTEIGKLNDYFKDKTSLVRNIVFTLWGQLIAFGDKLLLINYRDNQLLRLTEEAENRLRPLLFQHPITNLYYCIDSTLYFGNIAENRLASLLIHKNDFMVSDIGVYTKEILPDGAVMVIIVLLLLLITGWIVWNRKKKRTSKVNHSLEQPAIVEEAEHGKMPIAKEQAAQMPVKPAVIFNEKELRVIQLIAANSRKNIAISTDDLNKLLGLLNTSGNSQKNQRSQLFKSINERYRNWKNTEDDLIQSRPQKETEGIKSI